MKKITSLFLAAALLFSAVSPCMNANAAQTGTQSSGAVVSTEASSRFETRQSADGRYIYTILNDGTAMIVGCKNSYHISTDEYGHDRYESDYDLSTDDAPDWVGNWIIPEEIDGFTVTQIGGDNYGFISSNYEMMYRYSGWGNNRYSTEVGRVYMKSMHIPKTITKIDSSAPFPTETITVDENNPSYTVVDGVLFTKDMKTLVNYPCNLNPDTAYTVPDSVEVIADYAFSGSNLKEVKLPASVKVISSYAFYYSKIESVSMQEGVKFIGNLAFSYSQLKSVSVPDSVVTLSDNAFENCSNLSDYKFPESMSAPENFEFNQGDCRYRVIDGGLSVIGTCCDENVEELTIPAKVNGLTVKNISNVRKNVGRYYVEALKSLKTVHLPDTIESIGIDNQYSNGFYGCESLESINLPEGLKYIYEYSFSGCSSLKNFTLPSTLEVIDEYCFDNCSALNAKTIKIPSSVTTIYYNSISVTDGDYTYGYEIDDDSKTLGAVITNYTGSGSDWTVPSKLNGVPVKRILLHTYKYEPDFSSVKNFVIPEGVTSVQNIWFKSPLDSIKLPSSLKNIEYCNLQMNYGDYVCEFDSDKDENVYAALIEYTADEEVPVIPTSINGITVTCLGNNLFDSKTLLSITIPDTITSIGEEAFAWCSFLNEITIPDSVTYMGRGVFYNSDLQKAVLSKSITDIPARTFYGCGNLSSVDIPDGVTAIYYDAFRGCSSLYTLNIPSSVNYVADYAFYHSGIKSLPDTIAYVGKDVFDDGEPSEQHKQIKLPEGCVLYDNFAYRTFDNEKTGKTEVEIAKYYGDSLDVVIPEKINGLTVTSLDHDVFSDYSGYDYEKDAPRENIKSLILPKTITSIKDHYYQTNMGSAFSGCKLIDNGFRYEYHIDPYTESLAVRIIGAEKEFETLNIPSEINGYKVTAVGGFGNGRWGGKLNGAELLSTLYPEYPGESYVDTEAPADLSSSLKHVSIPDTVSTILWGAFLDCVNLEEITIPKSVKRIGFAAFYGCNSLKEVYLPENVTDLSTDFNSYDTGIVEKYPGSPFGSCNNLEKITVAKDNPAYCSVDGVLFTKDMKTMIQYPTGKKDKSYAIPNGVENLLGFQGYLNWDWAAEGVFAYNTYLEDVTIPESVEVIGFGTFTGCLTMSKLIIPSTVKEIQNGAFNRSVMLYNGDNTEFNASQRLTLYGENTPAVKEYFKTTYWINSTDNIMPIELLEAETKPEPDKDTDTDDKKDTDTDNKKDTDTDNKKDTDTDNKKDTDTDDKKDTDTDDKKDTDTDNKKDTDTDNKKDTDTDNKKDTDTDNKKDTDTDNKKDTDTDNKDDTIMMGDMDGDNTVTSADSLTILRASVKLETLTKAQEKAADVNGNGAIDSADSLAVLRFSVKLVDIDSIGTRIKVS